MQKKRIKRNRDVNFPYWPSKDFMDKSRKMLRDKGMNDGSDEEIDNRVLRAYRAKRKELLELE